jgi:hypothetical protein
MVEKQNLSMSHQNAYTIPLQCPLTPDLDSCYNGSAFITAHIASQVNRMQVSLHAAADALVPGLCWPVMDLGSQGSQSQL